MSKKEYPLSIENRWDILYSEYPEKYDEFIGGETHPDDYERSNLHDIFDFSGKIVADIGTGTGMSAFGIARYASKVYGIEPEKAMRDRAEQNREKYGITNVDFLDGKAQEIPLPDNSVDVVTAIYAVIIPTETELPKFFKEAERVTKPGGLVIMENTSPGWYGGNLNDVILAGFTDEQREWGIKSGNAFNRITEELGYNWFDYETLSNYESVEDMVNRYGFVFGSNVIHYIRLNKISSITLRTRVHYKRLGGDQ